MKQLMFTVQDVVDELNAADPSAKTKIRTITHWEQLGFVKATARPPRRGTERLFSFDDLLSAFVVKQLKQLGLPKRTIKKTAAIARAGEWKNRGVVMVVAVNPPYAWLARAHDVLTLATPGPKSFVDLHEFYCRLWESVASRAQQRIDQVKPQPVTSEK